MSLPSKYKTRSGRTSISTTNITVEKNPRARNSKRAVSTNTSEDDNDENDDDALLSANDSDETNKSPSKFERESQMEKKKRKRRRRLYSSYSRNRPPTVAATTRRRNDSMSSTATTMTATSTDQSTMAASSGRCKSSNKLSKIFKSEMMLCRFAESSTFFLDSLIDDRTILSNSHQHSTASHVQVPEAKVYTLSNGFDCNFDISKNLVKYWEKQEEDLYEQVEYDLDDEDLIWLDSINEERESSGKPSISIYDLAFLIDKLEKESFFQSSTSEKNTHLKAHYGGVDAVNASSDSINEDALCSVCMDGECESNNVIMFCDMCNLAVHQECYGVPYVPEGQWLCRRCMVSPSTPVSCVLCHSGGGAFKQTDRGEWVHVVCAIWVPEVHFANTVFLEPVCGIESIDRQRWKLLCYICRRRGGACIQCSKQTCCTAFHVTCAQQAGLYMNIHEEVRKEKRNQKQKASKKERNKLTAARKKKGDDGDEANVDKESEDHESDQTSVNNSDEVEVRKCAYCDLHTPIDELSMSIQKKLKRKGMSAVCREEFLKRVQKIRMDKARRVLAQKRSRPPVINLPVIPQDRQEAIAKLIEIEESEKFWPQLISYWKMKRLSRNGVPLVRRLQKSSTRPMISTSSSGSSSTTNAMPLETQVEQFMMLRRLRNDLERARLLIEMVKKREKLKREERLIEQLVTIHETRPFYVFLNIVLDNLVELDKVGIFLQPVDPNQAPGYYDFIKQPMDFSTMRRKISSDQYASFEQFENDLKLIINNCLTYNTKGDLFYNAGVKLRNQSASIMKNANKQYSSLVNEVFKAPQQRNSSSNLANHDENSRLFAARSPSERSSMEDTPTKVVEYKQLKEITMNQINKQFTIEHFLRKMK